LPSADVERAAQVGVQARVQNNGQSCIAAKRFIVHTDVYDAFEEAVHRRDVGLHVGDPMEPGTEVGPLATPSGTRRASPSRSTTPARRERRCSAVAATVDGPGFFYEPTVLAELTPQMRVYSEEVFGPVAMLYRARDADEALRLANDSPFGLGASVWTTDDPRAQSVSSSASRSGWSS
jgi:succinate-semialdehyde dehydrogenase/glutarate-semialdehyde dehydrogenase